MKKLTLSLLIVVLGFSASAQSQVKFGIKGGLTFPTLSFSENPGTGVNSNTLFYLGGTAEFPLGEQFSLQPGLTLNGKGFMVKESESDENGNVSVTGKSSLLYVEVPVNVLVNMPLGSGKFFIGAGPYFGMAVAGQTKVEIKGKYAGESIDESEIEDVKFGKDGEYNRADYGFNFLAGYQLSNGFNIHGGYGLGLANISAEGDVKARNRVLSVGIGFTLSNR